MKAPTLLCVALLVAGSSFADDKDKAAAPAQAATSPAAAAPKNVTPDEAEKLLKSQKDVVVLDVRTPDEFEAGHIAGAKNVDFQSDDFAQKIAQLDKNKTYLVHCAAGGRSTRALKQLKDFKSVYHMNGGISAWKEAGKPLEK
ncbi:rhodanese-like domain-containing protein [Verrucomicrobiota bacterium sgz303538]